MASNPFKFIEQPPILICGAGPTGLVASLWLKKCGIPFRIIDPAMKPGTTSRAMVVHARMQELYDQLDIIDRIEAEGCPLDGMRIYSGINMKGELRYEEAAAGQSKYPHILCIGQDKHEQLLNEICAERGINIERGLRISGMVENESIVDCTLENVTTGATESFQASYAIGADGAHSATRKAAGITMPGGTYANRAYVTDVEADSAVSYAGNFMNVNFGRQVFCVVTPFGNTTKKRVIGFVPRDQLDGNGNLKDVKELQFEDIEDAIREAAPTIKIKEVDWFSTYRMHHRVADGFQSTYKASDGVDRPGRIFIAGDAGHLHSPIGGQGMNTGIGDAVNLCWKLAAVHAGKAPATMLETYSTERRGFAESLVFTTDAVFQWISDPGWRGWFMRNIAFPYILTFIFNYISAVRTKLFRRVSQIEVSYPGSMLSTTGDRVTGTVKAGERLPWVEVDDTDNFRLLQACAWQAHVYGNVGKPVFQLLEDRSIPLHTFPWRASGQLSRNMHLKGLGKDMLYLVRPDGQIGLICTGNDDQLLNRYLDRWDIGLQVR